MTSDRVYRRLRGGAVLDIIYARPCRDVSAIAKRRQHVRLGQATEPTPVAQRGRNGWMSRWSALPRNRTHRRGPAKGSARPEADIAGACRSQLVYTTPGMLHVVAELSEGRQPCRSRHRECLRAGSWRSMCRQLGGTISRNWVTPSHGMLSGYDPAMGELSRNQIITC
jgi:hypothetical protein